MEWAREEQQQGPEQQRSVPAAATVTVFAAAAARVGADFERPLVSGSDAHTQPTEVQAGKGGLAPGPQLQVGPWRRCGERGRGLAKAGGRHWRPSERKLALLLVVNTGL